MYGNPDEARGGALGWRLSGRAARVHHRILPLGKSDRCNTGRHPLSPKGKQRSRTPPHHRGHRRVSLQDAPSVSFLSQRDSCDEITVMVHDKKLWFPPRKEQHQNQNEVTRSSEEYRGCTPDQTVGRSQVPISRLYKKKLPHIHPSKSFLLRFILHRIHFSWGILLFLFWFQV